MFVLANALLDFIKKMVFAKAAQLDVQTVMILKLVEDVPLAMYFIKSRRHASINVLKERLMLLEFAKIVWKDADYAIMRKSVCNAELNIFSSIKLASQLVLTDIIILMESVLVRFGY